MTTTDPLASTRAILALKPDRAEFRIDTDGGSGTSRLMWWDGGANIPRAIADRIAGLATAEEKRAATTQHASADAACREEIVRLRGVIEEREATIDRLTESTRMACLDDVRLRKRVAELEATLATARRERVETGRRLDEVTADRESMSRLHRAEIAKHVHAAQHEDQVTDEPHVTEWAVTEWAVKGNGDWRRNIGEFSLFVEPCGADWSWSVEWGDDTIAEGEEPLRDNEEAEVARAKAACEAAARRAGIAVPR